MLEQIAERASTGGQALSHLGLLLEELAQKAPEQMGPLTQALEHLDVALDHLQIADEEAYLDCKRLAGLSRELSRKLNERDVSEVICSAARELAQADGACVIFREGELVHYSRESAIEPLWAGQKFPISACISGWSILNRTPVVIEDIYSDKRIPIELYRDTFVKSLAIVPMERDSPIGAIGVYWARTHRPTKRQLDLLERLADLASIASVNVQLIENLETEIAVRSSAEQALRESDRWFRTMADTAPVMIWQSDTDKRCYYFNKPWLDFTGRTLADEMGNGWAEGVHPDDFWRCLQTYETAFDDRQDFSMEYRLRRHDGEYRWLLDNGVPVFSSDGAFQGYIGSCIDITDRMRAEESLRESQRQLASIIGSAMDAIITVDADQRVVLFNAAAEAMLLCPASEAIGRPLERFIPERFRDTERDYFRKLADSSITSRLVGTAGTLYGLRINGEEFPIEGSISRVEVDSHQLFTIIIRDVTRRRQYEDKLREQAALLDEATDAISVRDLEDRVLFWSNGAERIYGFTAEEAVGKHIREVYHKDIFNEFYEAKRLLIENGQWSGETRHVTKSGRNLAVLSRWTLLRDLDGNPKSVLVINTDITEKKDLEAQFLRAQRMESIGTLAAGIAHDINNVLSPILLAIRVLEKKLPDPDSRQTLKVLQTNAERGGNMVRRILEFAKGVKGERMILQPEHVITQVVKVLKDTLKKSIKIESLLPETLWAISADPTQIHQVLMNLFINAADAMPSGGTISVKADNISIDDNYARMNVEAKAGCYVRLSISDTGTGISPKIMDRIFDPFFTTKEPGKGTGLGLSTVLAIVKSHGGFINVDSREGHGTEFSIYFPAAASATVEHSQVASSELPRGHGELVLVIDDEPGVREITRGTLEAYGYHVVTASDGAEGVDSFARHKSDVRVVLTDLMMPYMDGPPTIRALRKLNPKIAIIVSSGLTADQRTAEAKSAGVNVFLPKPYTADALLNTLARVLAESSNSESKPDSGTSALPGDNPLLPVE